MIKLIIFDFTGVVVTGGHKKMSQIIGAKYGLSPEKVYEIIYTKYFNRFATNQITEAEAYGGFIKELKLKETQKELVEMYLKTHKINPEVVDYIKKLRKKYKTALLTKNIKHYLDWERKEFGLDDLFNDIINTSEINLPKASQETIEYVLNRFGVSPSEAVYIDDQDVNLLEAREMGVRTIFYKNFEQFKNELSEVLKI